MELLDGPRVVVKPARHYAGIRVVTPFRGMLAVRDDLVAELHAWLAERQVPHAGPTFFRLHVIDMAGPMDVEAGVVVDEVVTGADRVRPGVLPAGRYASLVHVNHSRQANKLLLEWARDNGCALDRWDGPGGDHFACRYEACLTHPRTERMKTRWQVELGILLTG